MAYDGTSVSTSSEQLAALRRKDPDVLRTLVDGNTKRLYRAARGMGMSADEADDLVQDVFVAFLGSLDRFEGRASVETWLFGILLRKVQERRRSKRKEQRHDQIDETWEAQFDADGRWVSPPIDPARALDSREISLAIRGCLKDLQPQQRDVFVLRQIDELSAAHVGQLLDLTLTNIGVILHRARLRMRECLALEGWRTSP